jgi:hypothetical protein
MILFLLLSYAYADEYVVHCDGQNSAEICIVGAQGFVPKGTIMKKPQALNCNPCRSEDLELKNGQPVENLGKKAARIQQALDEKAAYDAEQAIKDQEYQDFRSECSKQEGFVKKLCERVGK